ncbi:ARMADILLO BTB ARABIDOPSIS PROTEIN 1 [Ananas comosus]|uniref:ARMADILLO BTB ARABIDOPSIS PROTEIN 1 n=1 Tax=Ananas comosus TaxID=4615 RepID=A0A199UQ91_ANACO|nr:ARMADILLO BTB ARABIDOPSIS PROTEIN 1 [Ananas comosus]OAY66997.1 U-box domain-containing protein 12 [Ananas comosus]
MKLPGEPDPDLAAAADDGDDEELRRLLSAVSSAAAAARCFRGRWCAVAAAASRLSSAVGDLSNLAANPLASELLRSLRETLALALAIAEQCRSPDPPAGKLRTQSDLAAASDALKQLAADADLLLSSGALAAPAEAAAGASSLGEPVRVEVRGLVTRLQIGSSAARIAALGSLAALLAEDERNVAIAVAEGAVAALVRLLDSGAGGAEARERAAAAIARVSAVESCRHALAAEAPALLAHLVRVLESDGGGGAAREGACIALQTLTLARDGAMAIGSRGGIAALLEICGAGTPSAQAAAAGVLLNLSVIPELHQNFLEENSIPVLIRVFSSGTPLAQENAVACLHNLTAGDEEQSLKITVFKEGALECLRNYLENDRGLDQNLESAIGLLRNLASFRYIAEIISSAGFIPYIVSSLDSAKSSVRGESAKAIAELCAVERARKEMIEAVPLLIRMLESKGGGEEKEAALKALGSLIAFTAYRRLFKKDEKGIVNVVQLLDPLVTNVEKKHAISVLLSVSQSRKARKQMVALGACGFLRGLLATEVEGAKKLIEILGRGKILGVFPRA